MPISIIADIPYLKEHYSLDWWLHEDDFFLQSLAQQSARRYGISLPEPAVAENTWNMVISHLEGWNLRYCILRVTHLVDAV